MSLRTTLHQETLRRSPKTSLINNPLPNQSDLLRELILERFLTARSMSLFDSIT